MKKFNTITDGNLIIHIWIDKTKSIFKIESGNLQDALKLAKSYHNKGIASNLYLKFNDLLIYLGGYDLT